MAEFGEVNLTSIVAQPTTATEGPGLSVENIIAIVGGSIVAVGVFFAILTFCWTHGLCKNNGDVESHRPSARTSEEIPLQTQDGGPDGQDPGATVTDPPSVIKDLKYWQEQLRRLYEKLYIRTDTSNTSTNVADVDELSTEIKLCLETEETFSETLPNRETVLEKHRTIPLHAWTDFFDTKILKNSLIILSGGAGFGKSTLFKIIANSWTKFYQLAEVKLLFLIKLKEMKTSSVIDAILNQCFPQDEKPTRDDLITMIKENKKHTVFLLDGLDELSSEFCKPVDDVYCVDNVLHNKVFEDSRVLVATRQHKVAYILEDNPRCSHIETLGFTSANVDKFIMKYFSGDESKGKELISFLKGNPLLRNLAEIPVICQMICRISKMSQSKLSDRMTGLYKHFTEVLARRRCGDESDWKQRLETALETLGEVALDGLLLEEQQLELRKDDFNQCASILDDACEGSGFIQQTSVDSIPGEVVIVTFLHKTFQEYSAACYFASLYRNNVAGFHEKLEQINASNVESIKYLLRFTCGIASESEATRLILKHVQDLECRREHRANNSREEGRDPERLTRLLLFDSGSGKWADEVNRPAVCRKQPIRCRNQEDLIALQYYLQFVSLQELGNRGFKFSCNSCENLTALKALLLSGNIRPAGGHVSDWSMEVKYTMGERGNKETEILMETLEGMDEKLRDQLSLELSIDETARFDENCLLGHLPSVREVQVYLWDLSCDDLNCLANAVKGCRLLWSDVVLYRTKLSGHVSCLAPLITPSLYKLHLLKCGLNDEDVTDLLSMFSSEHGLTTLRIEDSAFSFNGVKNFTAGLQCLPDLCLVFISSEGLDRHVVNQVIKQNLPNVY